MSEPNHIPLSTQQIESNKFAILGTGIWGTVLDVGDETILKLARQKCAGIGDGLEKIRREAHVLRAIESQGHHSSLSFAKVRGWGQRSNVDSRTDDDRNVWLHTSRVPGRTRSVAELKIVSGTEVLLISSSICRALVEVHEVLQRAAPITGVSSAKENLEMIASEIRGDLEGSLYLERFSRILVTLENEPTRLIHGDFNISNLLFEGTTVRSVIDFAETRVGFPEEDLAAIITELPFHRYSLLQSYQLLTNGSVVERRLTYGLAMQSFLSYLISRRMGSQNESNAARSSLEQLLRELDHG